MSLVSLIPEQQKARGSVLLAEAKRDPEAADFLSFLPTRISGYEAWMKKLGDANRRFLESLSDPSQSLKSDQ